ncbi:radical SAM protein [Marinifilum flexuosum]|uniref:radical SAM protein n=1 Tax=Marinifilum flexuosum TaxID=1117708 RepID=UPI002491113A|nr:radical SAM protein [Marinifilum flexuosum]
MNFEGTTYRPPVEANSMLLQVTVGCAHNQCTYCNMYDDVKFRVINTDQIEKDLIELRRIYKKAERFFLVNGDAFVLSANKLKKISELIKRYFPECNTISMYASIQNIQSKSDNDLRELKNCGINDLWVGVESGWNTVILDINKGYTVEEAKTELSRLSIAGINYMAGLMLGVAGKDKGIENAKHTADFLNETKPKLIWAGTLGLFEGTPMAEDAKKGIFLPATEIEILEEEKALINGITLTNVPFYGIHPTNTFPVIGNLPADKQSMIDKINDGINEMGRATLSQSFQRNSL